MTRNINDIMESATSKEITLGWLTWWTLDAETYKAAELQSLADQHNAPSEFVAQLAPRSEESCFRRTVNAFSRPRPSRMIDGVDPEGSEQTYRMTTVPNRPNTRIMVRDVKDGDKVEISSEQVAYIMRADDGSILIGHKDENAPWHEEVSGIMDAIKDEYLHAIGYVDEGTIRSALLSWLNRLHRVTVRKAGGVYFVPRPVSGSEATITENEIGAITEFINALNSPTSMMSAISISPTGGTNIKMLQEQAIAELESEAEEINDRLKKYATRKNMNDGSRKFSASQMVERSSRLRDRMETLIGSLGEDIAVLDEMIAKVQAAAVKMQQDAEQAVAVSTKEKKTRKQAKEYDNLTKEWKKIIENGNPNRDALYEFAEKVGAHKARKNAETIANIEAALQSKKLSGTVEQRNKEVTL